MWASNISFLPSVYSPLWRAGKFLYGQHLLISVPHPLSSPCSALGLALGTSHPPALWPVAACVAGSPVRGRWGRLSRWYVEGAGDGSGHLGGPHAAGETPCPCSSARKRRRVLISGPSFPYPMLVLALLSSMTQSRLWDASLIWSVFCTRWSAGGHCW